MEEKEMREVINSVISKFSSEDTLKDIDLNRLKTLVFEEFDRLAPNENIIIKNMTYELIELIQQYYAIKEVFEQDLPNLLKDNNVNYESRNQIPLFLF